MKNKLDNIEELFRSSFDGFEADVDPNVWSQISNQIGSAPSAQGPSDSGISATGSSAGSGTFAGIAKIAVMVGAAGVLSYGGYQFFKTEEISQPVADKIEVVSAPQQIQGIEEEPVIVEQEITTKEKEEADKEIEAPKYKAKQDGKINTTTVDNKVVESHIDKVAKPEGKSQQVSKTTKPAENKVSKQPVEKDDESGAVSESQLKAKIYTSVATGHQPLEVRFENLGTTTGSATWKFRDDGEITNDSYNTSHTFEKVGKHWVVLEVRDEKGHVAKDSVIITVKARELCKAQRESFSPNGDGINDAFVVECEGIRSLRCTVYNRAQKMVFEWNNLHGHWDGRDMNGDKVPAGVYFYVVEAVDNGGNAMDPLKGSVTVY